MTDVEGFNSVDRFISRTGGVLLVDKPRDWTSFDVVKKVRGMLRVKKVGHAGTLDPLATGLLILCSSTLTKRIDAFQALPKVYEGVLRLGAVTASYDAASEESDHRPTDHIDDARIREGAALLTGSIMQLPPMFSAVKVDGQRLYNLARKGLEVERKQREVMVHSFELGPREGDDVAFVVHCSKGTYVRTLAHDLGAWLGCGAYLRELRRVAIGEFHVDEAWNIDRLHEQAQELRNRRHGEEAG